MIFRYQTLSCRKGNLLDFSLANNKERVETPISTHARKREKQTKRYISVKQNHSSEIYTQYITYAGGAPPNIYVGKNGRQREREE